MQAVVLMPRKNFVALPIFFAVAASVVVTYDFDIEEADSVNDAHHAIDGQPATLVRHVSGAQSAPLPGHGAEVAVQVYHRETVIGCHSLERFLDPGWETFFVFDSEFARGLHVEELVMDSNKDPAVTRGAHLLEMSKASAQYGAFRTMFDMERQGKLEMPPLFLSVECAIHPLPAGHPSRTSFADSVHIMLEEFKQERGRRLGGSSAVEMLNEAVEPYTNDLAIELCPKERFKNQHFRQGLPLLFMNAVVLDTLQRDDSLKGSLFHSYDVGKWQARKADEGFRPVSAKDPWLSDVSLWFEDHFVLYPTEFLWQIVKDIGNRFDSMIEMARIMPALLCQHSWAAARYNDLVYFYDHGSTVEGYQKLLPPPLRSHRSIFDGANIYRNVNLTWLEHYNLKLLTYWNSPGACMREWILIKEATGFETRNWCGYAPSWLREGHIAVPVGQTVAQAYDILKPFMELAGYNELNRTADEVAFVRIPFAQSLCLYAQQGPVDSFQGVYGSDELFMAFRVKSNLLRLFTRAADENLTCSGAAASEGVSLPWEARVEDLHMKALRVRPLKSGQRPTMAKTALLQCKAVDAVLANGADSASAWSWLPAPPPSASTTQTKGPDDSLIAGCRALTSNPPKVRSPTPSTSDGNVLVEFDWTTLRA